jgi:hypothetical protein
LSHWLKQGTNTAVAKWQELPMRAGARRASMCLLPSDGESHRPTQSLKMETAGGTSRCSSSCRDHRYSSWCVGYPRGRYPRNRREESAQDFFLRHVSRRGRHLFASVWTAAFFCRTQRPGSPRRSSWRAAQFELRKNSFTLRPTESAALPAHADPVRVLQETAAQRDAFLPRPATPNGTADFGLRRPSLIS